MKIVVTLVLTVDRSQWELMYGSSDDFRNDVKYHVLNDIQCTSASDEGAITEVELKK